MTGKEHGSMDDRLVEDLSGAAVERSDEMAPESGDVQDDMPLEGRLRRLDEIVRSLEADDVGLDRGLELFEEGVRHIRSAERMLAEAELKVEELIGEGDRTKTQPLESGE